MRHKHLYAAYSANKESTMFQHPIPVGLFVRKENAIEKCEEVIQRLANTNAFEKPVEVTVTWTTEDTITKTTTKDYVFMIQEITPPDSLYQNHKN